jgi:hypothetical protein
MKLEKTMKKITSFWILLASVLFLTSCGKMDDNYRKYLAVEKIYSPKVTNLRAEVGLKTALIRWDNPSGNLAKKILVDWGDDSLKFDHMVDSATLVNLEIKGYTVSVYTMDAFNNYSVPVSIQIFPNGE